MTMTAAAPNLKGRNFLKLLDFSPDEIRYLIDLAAELKAQKKARTEPEHLRQKEICLIFEKTSTRTRCAFEVAAYDQGAHVTYLDPQSSQMGHKETVKDTARVLGPDLRRHRIPRLRPGNGQTLADYAGVPVWNGLTDEFHPTQILADILTMREHSSQAARPRSRTPSWATRATTWATRCSSAARSWAWTSGWSAPRELWPHDELVAQCQAIARRDRRADHPDRRSVEEGVKGADFLYTDVWVSMGEPKEVWTERIRLLSPYQVNAARDGRHRQPHTKFMHCLPAFHNAETKVGKQMLQDHGISEMEVTDEVFESPASIVFDQAENRMHTIKAILVATIGS